MDREKKELKIASSKTGYKIKTVAWKLLFDPGKEEFQEQTTDKLNDEDFKKTIIAGMAQNGYQMKAKK